MSVNKYVVLVLLTAFASVTSFAPVVAQEGSLSDEYVLIKAVKDRNYGKVRSQLQKGANVNTRDYDSGATPLYLAATLKDTVAATFLLAENANPDLTARSTGETPLMVAVRLRAKEFTEILLSQNADVDISDKNGETALYKAVRVKDRSIAKALLDANADWSIADHTGRTPLDLAREDPRLRSMVRILEEGGAEY